jgi:hypothetical protein
MARVKQKQVTPQNRDRGAAGHPPDSPQTALGPGEIEAQLGPLETLEDAMRRLDRIGIWAASGVVSGAVAVAVVRSVEVWIHARRAHQVRTIFSHMDSEPGARAARR